MHKIIEHVRLLRRYVEPGDFILAFMYAFVGIFAIESHAVMSFTYMAVGVVHVAHIAHESREKRVEIAEKSDNADKLV